MRILKCDICGHEANSISERAFTTINKKNKTYDVCSLCKCKYNQLILNVTNDFIDGKITAQCFEC